MSTLRKNVKVLYKEVVDELVKQNIKITTMESCTGGLLASTITNVEGSSNILKYSFVAYSNEAKINFGVEKEIIEHYGVYSPKVAHEMAVACLKPAKEITKYPIISVGITGILNRPDPVNFANVDNRVCYSAIMIHGDSVDMREGDIFIPSDMKNREKMKLFVVEKIGHVIKDMLLFDTN